MNVNEMRSESRLPSGEQFELRLGEQRAVVTEVGATLRSFTVGAQEFLDPFPIDQMSSDGRGQVLLPWPNRIDRGLYTFDGEACQAPLNEPAQQNAIHGLTRWLSWTPIEHTPTRVVLGLFLHQQPGYPFALAVEVAYTLSAEGLEVRTAAHNAGARPAPFGSGQHPYFRAGTPRVDDTLLLLPARTYLLTDDRSIPRGRAAVAGTEFDFRTERPIGPLQLDTCFTDLERDADGRFHAQLMHPNGAPRITIAMDSSYHFAQVFTGDTLPNEAARRRGVAIEPMTCAPNAFNSGDGLRVLAPGETWTGSWWLSVG
jgi:aldose 1-epimerase